MDHARAYKTARRAAEPEVIVAVSALAHARAGRRAVAMIAPGGLPCPLRHAQFAGLHRAPRCVPQQLASRARSASGDDDDDDDARCRVRLLSPARGDCATAYPWPRLRRSRALAGARGRLPAFAGACVRSPRRAAAREAQPRPRLARPARRRRFCSPRAPLPSSPARRSLCSPSPALAPPAAPRGACYSAPPAIVAPPPPRGAATALRRLLSRALGLRCAAAAAAAQTGLSSQRQATSHGPYGMQHGPSSDSWIGCSDLLP